MFGIIFRILWRLIIFAMGGMLVWVTVFKVYPYADKQLPAVIVLLFLYCIFAYLILPALIRLFRLVIKPNHIPLYATSGDGWPADPVNIAIVAHNKQHLINAMEAAGWYLADKATARNCLREAYSIIFNQPYLRAPFSNLYLFNQPFDIGFQKPANGAMSARTRHHVRFWQLELTDLQQDTPHFRFWHPHLHHLFAFEKKVWIGAAIDDISPFGIRWRYGQVTHKNNPDTNLERDLIIDDLRKIKLAKSAETIHAGEPFSFRGQTLGNNFLCDGTIKIVGLKNPILATITARRQPSKKQ